MNTRPMDGKDEGFISSRDPLCILGSAQTNLPTLSKTSFRSSERTPNGLPTIDGEPSCLMDGNLRPRLGPKNSETS